jgi:bifunctional N-acetylglucosamine-1-phosphate-uridyltransferase/glucosamine-1-phosphate-acetyltransferase GlmU-like protein
MKIDAPPPISLTDYIAAFSTSPLARWTDVLPWEMTQEAPAVVRKLLATLDFSEFNVSGEVAIHTSATVEDGAIIKGPCILGAHCFVAAGAYLRGGNWVADHCTFGPGAELKSSFVFQGTKLAHFNFVGDAILGSDVNLEAGSIICNYRNERENKEVHVHLGGRRYGTGCDKFGAVVGDHSRIGANAVIAPGAILPSGCVVCRASLWDSES